MNKHTVKHHRNCDTKPANRDHARTIALERSVMNFWAASTSLLCATSPSVTDVVQTFSLLFGSSLKGEPRKSIVRLTERANRTSAVYCKYKAVKSFMVD